MPVTLLGLGVATPPRSIEQLDAADVAQSMIGGGGPRVQVIRKLFEKAGVARRGSVLLEPAGEAGYQQSFYPPAESATDRGPSTAERLIAYQKHAPQLAGQACESALQSAGTLGESVTHLITVSCTGLQSPGVDFHLIDRLGLPATVTRTNIGFMGCHGAFNGMRVAQAFAESDENAVVLMCCVELCSLHCIYGWHPQRMVASSLFADGSAAMVVQKRAAARQNGLPRWSLQATGTMQFPHSLDEMSWTIGDFGFEMTLSPEVPKAIERELAPWLNKWLGQQGLTTDDIGSWAIHPGGPRIIDAAANAIGLGESQTAASFEVLANHGNMSSATIMFVIDQLRKSQAQLPCVAMAFGPGLVVEAALFL